MRRLVTLALIGAASPALAGDLTVLVRTVDGEPVRNAVVSLYPGGKAVAVDAPSTPYRIEQRNIQFSPFVLVVPVGARVTFPNYDDVRHHVYSFSPAKRFELKLYAKEQNRLVSFDKAGAVPLGCNIHDKMAAFVKVTDTAFAAQSNASGKVSFSNAPAGRIVARIWHPYLRAPGNQMELRWALPAAGQHTETVTIKLRPPPRVRSSY